MMLKRMMGISLVGIAGLSLTLAVADALSFHINSAAQSFSENTQELTATTQTLDASVRPAQQAVVAQTTNLSTQAQVLSAQAPDLDPQAIKLGLEAYNKAHQEGYDTQQLLTIVDYDKPSVDPRLFVFDLKSDKMLYQELVAHGKNSGGNIPDSFSDAPRSLKSSLGLFLTENTYVGKHGTSLRLQGLEHGFNDMAMARDIVVHAASYVSTAFGEAHGRLGKSWGCFAVNPAVASTLINTIKGGTLLFAYYPDHNYLTHSTFLKGNVMA